MLYSVTPTAPRLYNSKGLYTFNYVTPLQYCKSSRYCIVQQMEGSDWSAGGLLNELLQIIFNTHKSLEHAAVYIHIMSFYFKPEDRFNFVVVPSYSEDQLCREIFRKSWSRSSGLWSSCRSVESYSSQNNPVRDRSSGVWSSCSSLQNPIQVKIILKGSGENPLQENEKLIEARTESEK